ncbi:MAG: DUF6089 family protein [Bacteroidales bacterium]|nr:DUF6089 family protein [Bacteroidales bacterium]
MYAIRTTLLAILLLSAFKFYAQDCFYERNIHEIGVIGGASYYTGDFNPNRTPLTYPSWYAGAMYRLNNQRYFNLRGQVGYGFVRGSGENVKGIHIDYAGNDWRFNRPWFFIEALAEFNFMPYYPADIRKKQRFTPVLITGIGGSYLFANQGADFQPHLFRDASGILVEVPVGFGIKWCFIERFTLGIDWIWRLTLYDQIDYYSPIDPKHSNPISKDWIGSVGITLSYLIKEKLPCAAYYTYKLKRKNKL